MNYNLPFSVVLSGEEVKIRNECDFRVVLDCLSALSDEDLEVEDRFRCALFIFYDGAITLPDVKEAASKMVEIINGGEKESKAQKAPLMDWEHDFPLICPAVSRVLGYDVRDPNRKTHWWTFLSAYMEIGECTFTQVLSIRNALRKGQKLDKAEKAFLNENRELVSLPVKMSEEGRAWLEEV